MAADLNGDGWVDLAAANPVANTIVPLLNQKDGTFRAVGAYGAGIAPQAIAAGDWNGDGRVDLAVANGGSMTVSLFLNTGGLDYLGVPPAVAGRMFRLLAPRPNPTRGGAAFGFVLPSTAPVSIEVFDLAGRLVRSLAARSVLTAGPHTIAWDGRDGRGNRVGSGVYLVRARTADAAATAKVAVEE